MIITASKTTKNYAGNFGETITDNSWMYTVLCEMAEYCSLNGLEEVRGNILTTLDSLSLETNRQLLPARR